MIKDIIDKNETVKVNDREMAVLKENFPSCFDRDGKFDIVKFQEGIKDKVDIIKEGYELNFLGKSYAKLLASIETTTVIKPDLEHNNKPENENSENIYISGDNLDALKHLAKSYAGQVKCIYIDPPYNTGSDGFVYNDKFEFTVEDLVQKLSVSEDEATRILDLTKRGSTSHSAWLTFMYPRLLLARDMLKKEGCIFISLDDNEICNLRLLMDYIFGEENFVGQITVVANPRGRDYGGVARMHDYILVYKRSDLCELNLINDENSEFTMFDDIGGFELRELRNRNIKFNKENRPNLFYPFYINESKKDNNGLFDITIEPIKGWYELYPLESQGINTVWRWGKIKSIENINVNIKAKKMKNGGYQIVEKYREAKKMARSVWWDTDTNTEKGTLTVKEMFNAKVFDYPKPVEMLERIIQMATDNEEDDIVMDFFSGSASFAHAVLAKNAKENYINKFIMIQLTEKVKEGSIAESEGFETIDEIGQKRIELAAKKIKEENPEADIDYGFKHFTLVEPSAITIDKLESFEQNSMVTDNDILKEFGKETVLATWLNGDGYGLTCTPQEIDLAGYKAYYMGKHLYLLDAEFNNEAQKALFEKYSNEPSFNPENIVLFGYSFSKWTILDSLQTNFRQLANKKINFDIRY